MEILAELNIGTLQVVDFDEQLMQKVSILQ
jgi:hypothetical protein